MTPAQIAATFMVTLAVVMLIVGMVQDIRSWDQRAEGTDQ